MPKITRALQKIFAGDVPANNNVAVFGSLKAGSPAYSNNPDTIQSLSAYGTGWSGATILNQAPALQDMNALQYLFSRQIAYLMQAGVAEYLSTQTYYIGSIVNSAGVLYVSQTDDNIGNAVTNETYWKQVVPLPAVKSISTTYTITTNDYYIKATGSTNYTVTLPAISSAIAGQTFVIKSTLSSGFLLTVEGTGGALIDTVSSVVLSPYQSLSVWTDGTQWYIDSAAGTSATVKSISTTYSIVSSDYIIKATGASGYTVTLPAAVSGISGETHIIKSNLSSGILTLAAAGANTIDGQVSVALSQYQSVTVTCDGSNWMIV